MLPRAVSASSPSSMLPTEWGAACAAADWLANGAITRAASQVPGEIMCHRARIASSMVIDLEVVQPAGAPPARLALLSAACMPLDVPSFRSRGASAVTASVANGEIVACVMAQDTRRALGSYKLLLASQITIESAVAHSVSDAIEIEPEGFTAIGNPSVSDAIEIEPEGLGILCRPSVSDAIEIEPEGLKPVDLDVRSAKLPCIQAPGDDHGDGLRCASLLGLGSGVTRLIGSFANGWGDDQDSFRFDVDERIDFEAILSWHEEDSGHRAELMLFDAQGHQLAFSEPSDVGRLQRTLEPGSYVLRAEASASDARYRLDVLSRRLVW